MRSINFHEAKTQLSRLVEAAARGEGFIIAKAGKPRVKLVAIDAPAAGGRRQLGFLEGAFSVPIASKSGLSTPVARYQKLTLVAGETKAMK
jgi:antitoxin (DNA-binding transcriptional repressor) of toxin-antitoxin stability system